MKICVNSVDFRLFTVKETDRRQNRCPRGPDQHSLRHPRKVEASDRRRDYYVHYMVPIDRRGIPQG